ncbi:MAG: hypothetical protein V4484_24010 [Pseudomonadota bacterium]
MKTLPLRLYGTVALCTFLTACSGVAATPIAVSTLKQQLQAEIGDAACDSAQQCKTVAVGHKACGGPEGYLPWSSKRSDGAKITWLAAALAAESQSQTIKSGMVSTCSMVLDPGATCVAGHCAPGQSGPVAR